MTRSRFRIEHEHDRLEAIGLWCIAVVVAAVTTIIACSAGLAYGQELTRRKTVGGQVRTDGQGRTSPGAARDRVLDSDRWKRREALRAGAAAGHSIYTSSAAAVRHELATRSASKGTGEEKAKATSAPPGHFTPHNREPRPAAQGEDSSSESAVAESKPTGLHSPERVTTLLRGVVAEATWLERDHRAVLHVLDRRAARAGVAVDEMARMYISAFKRAPERTWVLELEPTCEQPPSWPESLDWETWRPQCELTVERVVAFLDGNSIDPCKGRAMHFGARNLAPDIANAASARWSVVSCGGTASIFYADRRDVVSAQEAQGSR